MMHEKIGPHHLERKAILYVRPVSYTHLFELLLRNSISETLSHRFGSHPYYTIAAFKDPTSNLKALQAFASVYEKSKDRRAKHYRETYGHPALPPIWTMKELSLIHI